MEWTPRHLIAAAVVSGVVLVGGAGWAAAQDGDGTTSTTEPEADGGTTHDHGDRDATHDGRGGPGRGDRHRGDGGHPGNCPYEDGDGSPGRSGDDSSSEGSAAPSALST